MTLEQQQALARARARAKLRQVSLPKQEKPAPQPDDVEMVAGTPAVRFALGAGNQIVGLSQLVSKALSPISEYAGASPFRPGDMEQIKKRGMTPAADLRRLEEGRAILARLPGYEAQVADIDRDIAEIRGSGASANPKDAGFDVAGTLGTAAAGGAATKGIQAAPTVLGRIGQGAAIGAAAGASTPVTEGEDFWRTKATQTGTGAAIGGAVPAAVEVVKGGARVARDVADLFTDEGAGRILTRYQDKIIGPKGRDQVVEALKNAREPVPGYQPTAAEAVAKVPAGSPIIAHQKITAGTPGGPSAEFGQRVLDQKKALEDAVKARAVATDPMRQVALSGANAGGVKSEAVTSGIDATLGRPGIRASDVVGKTLNSVKERIGQFTDEAGVINADDLYTIRKEIGNTIKSHAKETANWDKRLAAGLERDVQKAIDDAIEAAGGTGWKDYLSEFASRSTGIEAAKDAVKAAAKPVQRTNLGGGVNVAEESRLHLPQMLSRPMMVANAVMKRIGSGIEPRLDAEATRRYLNPQELAKALEKLPPEQQSVAAAMLQRLGIISAAEGAASQEQF
jgi:hypothetical protein